MLGNHSCRIWCLQEICQHLSLEDSLAARLTCSRWHEAISLPQVSLCLQVAVAGTRHESCEKLQLLAGSLQRNPSALVDVSRVVLRLAANDKQPSVGTGIFAAQQELVLPEANRSGPPSKHAVPTMQLFSDVLAAMPRLSCLSITVDKPNHNQVATSPLTSAIARALARAAAQPPPLAVSAAKISSTIPPQACHVLLLQLLSLPKLQQQLQSLSLKCEGLWPDHGQLAAALLQCPQLRSLQLQDCPVSALAKLPGLSQLQELSFSGRYHEPVHRSYSVRQLPLLPPLPKLRKLQLTSLPYDVQQQERDATRAYCSQAAISAAISLTSSMEASTGDACSNSCSSSSSYASDGLPGAAVGLSSAAPGVLAPAPATGLSVSQQGVAAAADGASGRLLQQSVPQSDSGPVADWRTVEHWASTSIVLQCPSLQELCCDLAVGPGILRLSQLCAPDAPESWQLRSDAPVSNSAYLARANLNAAQKCTADIAH